MRTNKRHSTSLLAALAIPAITTCLSACSAPPAYDDPAAARTEEGRTEEGLTSNAVQTCPPGPNAVVIAFAQPGETPACSDVPGNGGAWIYSGPKGARACTATRHPGRGKPYACTYGWSPASGTPAAPPDTRALDALPDVYVAEGSGGSTTCGDSPMLSYAALLDEAEVSCPALPGSGGPDGPRPCEVCGVPLYPGVIYSSLWLPASSSLHTVSIGLSNGTRQILSIRSPAMTSSTTTASRGRHAYFPIALPDLPDGVFYEDGPALGYGYTAPRTP